MRASGFTSRSLSIRGQAATPLTLRHGAWGWTAATSPFLRATMARYAETPLSTTRQSSSWSRTLKPPALVLITTSFPIAGDGSEAAGAFVGDLALELARHTQVRVVGPGPETRRETWAPGVEVFRYAAPPQALSTLKPWKLRDWPWIARVLRGGLSATRNAVAADPHCRIVALWALPCGDWARRVARERGLDYAVWMLGSDVWTLGRIPVVRQILAHTIRQAKRAYADGYQLATDAQHISGKPIRFLPSTRHIACKQPIPPRKTSPYRLLFLGRWHPNKGVDLLLDALAGLRDEDWSCIESVEIQGGGPMEALVRERTAALRAKGRPVEAGRFLSKDEAEAAIQRADWVLIPSRIESIPVVFSDAMKLSRPVVAMPVGDLPALLRQSACGVLAGAVDASSYRLALQTACRTDLAGFQAGVAAMAEQFDLSRVATRLLERTDTDG
ncbi:glycosyltransferase [Roseateles sp. DB2]|uniref:glycosyltransferase n=1 Tax=Roseateles sp. DB2 TaxID=3453717 RepID=UPI003EE91856